MTDYIFYLMDFLDQKSIPFEVVHHPNDDGQSIHFAHATTIYAICTWDNQPSEITIIDPINAQTNILHTKDNPLHILEKSIKSQT